MALPKLETPTFKVKVPSTGKTIEYRPFLVKEEKLLLMMGEGTDQKQTSEIVAKLLESCIQTKIDIKTLTTFDLEYIFLNLRAKSVGEDVSIMIGCEECNEKCPVDVNIETDVYIDYGGKKISDIDFMVTITDSVGVEMKFPTIDLLTDLKEDDSVGMIIKCMKSIYDKDTVHSVTDYTDAEVREFINSLSVRDVQKLQTFFDEMPKVKCKIKFTCPHCGHENDFEIGGLSNFF